MSKKKIMAILFAFVLVMATTISAFAAVTEYVVTDSAGQVYVYDFEDLQQSYENYLLGVGSTALFDHYLDKVETGQVTAVYDDVSKRYVDFAAMDEAYTALVLEGKEDTFDMEEYTAGDSAVAKEMPATVIGVELDETGEVKEEEKPVTPVVAEFKVIEISAVDANTIKVTFAGEGAPAEAVEVVDFTPAPLVDGENTVTFTYNEKEFTEKVTYEAPAALAVVGVSAIDETTIEVTFDNEEIVEVTLDEALVHGQTEVTFLYEEVEYTAELTEAWVDETVVEQEIAEAVDAAINAINEIGNPATVTLEDEATVLAARTAVDAALELGAEETAIVNLDQLVAAEATITDLKDALDEKQTAIQDAKTALLNLPLEVTLEDKEVVVAARTLVDDALALGAEETDFVNLWKLEGAEATIAELEAEAADAEAAKAVEEAITALPAVEELTVEDAETVADARADYDALTEAQQALVPNVDVLETAEAKIVELEEAEAAELAEAKETAKAELDEYVDAAEYEVNAEALATAIADGKEAVDAAETTEDVEAAVVAAKEAIDAIETDEEIAVREAEEALVAATDAVVVAEESLLEADLADARELLDALEDSDEKVLLGARLDSLQLKLNGIRDAVNNATTEIQLDRALNVKPFVDYDVANITDYLIARGANVFTTIADIQEDVIDAGNATAEAVELGTLVTTATNAVIAAEADPDGDVAAPGTGTLIAAAQEAIDALPAEITEAQATAAGTVVTIKADLQERLEDVKIVAPVVAATNQIELLPALENNFDRVNEDLIANYETNLLATDITVAAIQGKIDVANLSAAQTAVGDAETNLTVADVDAAQALVNYLPEDVAPATTKADLQNRLDVVNAVIALDNATTEAGVLAALKAEVLDLDNINDALAEEYKAKVDGLTLAYNTDLQNNVVNVANTEELNDALDAIGNTATAYDGDTTDATLKANFVEALERLAAVTAHETDATKKFDLGTIDMTILEDYAASSTIKGITNTSNVKAVQDEVKVVNDAKEVNALVKVIKESTDVAETKQALIDLANMGKATNFLNTAAADRNFVAEQLVAIVDRADLDTETKINTEVNNANTIVTTALTAVNALDNTATEAATITALENVKVFDDLATIAKKDVANRFIAQELEVLEGTDTANFKSYTQLENVIKDLIAAQ